MAEVDLGRVQGFSAYEVAKQNGYVGTEAQWLESLHGPKGNDGAPGKDGADGISAGFGTPMASVDANVGTPSVTIEASGSNAAKVFNFIFKNLKGEKGDKGERGPAGSVVVDDALSSTSTNPVQNKVVKAEFDKVNSNLSQQSIEAMDLKMLGWTVPKECPVQNYVDSYGVYHQIVGRVDLGSLDWSYATNPNRFNAYFSSVKFVDNSTPIAAHSTKYDIYSFDIALRKDKAIGVYGSNGIASILVVLDSSYTDADTFKNAMQGVYLYYELAEEKTISVDGNEVVDRLKNDLSDLKDGTTKVAKATAADTAAKATMADSATKASQDGEGNNIAATYAKKTEIPGGGSTAENVIVVAVSGVSQSVVNNSKCKNDRVVLGFYITVAAGNYNTIRIADITSDHGPTEVVYGTAICTTKYSGFDEYTKPYPFQVNKAKSIYLKINETFATNMTFYISLAYDI